MTQSISVGRRLFVRSFKMPGVWLEWFLTPTNPPTFSGYWVVDDHGFLVEVCTGFPPAWDEWGSY